MKLKIIPSLMGKSQQEINLLFKKLPGRHLHLDVADGKAVPNTSLWFPFRLSGKFSYTAHLMIRNPLLWVKKHGHKVNGIVFNVEHVKNVEKVIELIKKKGKKVGIALNPETKVSSVKEYFEDLDYVLILTVHPGFYGAKYLKSPLKKIGQIRKLNPKLKVIVDGGMNPKTIRDAKEADIIVSGSYIAKSENSKKKMRELQRAVS